MNTDFTVDNIAQLPQFRHGSLSFQPHVIGAPCFAISSNSASVLIYLFLRACFSISAAI